MARPPSLKTVVSRVFATSPRPIYLLDAAQKIVYHNPALPEWLGFSAERQLTGLKCLYAPSDRDATSLSAEDVQLGRCLAVPPQISDAGVHQSTLKLETGACRTASYIALNDDEDSTLVIVGDTNELTETMPRSSGLDVADLHAQVTQLRQDWSEAFRLESLLGDSAAMRQVRKQVQLAAKTYCRVVVIGKPGSGRQRVARTIHREQTEGRQPLVPLDCGLLDTDLLEATIESIVRQLAESEGTSTLLLLEVDRLSIEAQATLIGFLEIGELGLGTLATSTHRLSELVEQQRFRHDLACQLSSLEILLPTLSERMEDLPALIQWALEHSKHGHQLGGFAEDALEALLRYPFPGELEELTAIVEEVASTATGSMVTAADLPRKVSYAADANSLPDLVAEDVNLDAFLAEVETELIARALKQSKGNRAQAARSLGVSRGKLLRRIEQLGIGE